MPRARTATTVTLRSRMGGICHALAISHAETPASASALPSASTPNATAIARRGSRGRSSKRPATNGSVQDKAVAPDLDHTVTDGTDRLSVTDHHDRRALAGHVPDRLQDAGFVHL